MIAVADTSAVLRLFIPDGPIPCGFEAFFRGVESGVNIAIAPELLIVEAVSVICRKERRGELTTSEAEELVGYMSRMPIRYFSHLPYVISSHRLALETGLTAYDALFLALAMDRGAGFFTADEKLRKVASGKGLIGSV